MTAKASVSAKITESPNITLKAQGTKTKKNTKSALPTIVAPDNNLGAAAPSTSAAEVAKPSTSAVEVAESSEVVVSSEAAESVATTAATAVTSAAAGATASAKTTQSGRRTRSAKRFRTKTAKTAKATKTNGAAQSTAPAANTNASSAAASSSAPTSAASSSASITTKAGAGGIPTANPTTPVPVSRAGGTLQPSAAAEANKRDATATRAFSNVEIRAPNGQCISVDPTAGDFRQNLIPVSLVDCSGSPNEKWDVITAGVHNKPGRIPATLIVSTLVGPISGVRSEVQWTVANYVEQTQGCISFDGRRTAGDTVTLFSCGGRADGGKTPSCRVLLMLDADPQQVERPTQVNNSLSSGS